MIKQKTVFQNIEKWVDKNYRILVSSFVPSPPNPPPSFSTQRGGKQLPLPFIARAAQLGAHNFSFNLILPQSRKMSEQWPKNLVKINFSVFSASF